MSSNDATQRTSGSSNTLSQGTKRHASSLFVEAMETVDDSQDEEHLDDADNRGTKRLKRNSNVDDVVADLDLDAEGNVVAYSSAEAEGRPRLGIYHDGFRDAERTVSEICSEFIAVVEQAKEEHGCEVPEINNICERNLKTFLTPQAEYPIIGPVALLGSAGIGKSSFTGCVLDSRGAAPESDGTKRGTNVVHEYSAALPNQTALYQVGAIYYSENEVRNLVKEHSINVFKYLSRKDDEEMEEDDLDDLQKQYDNAIEFFQTVLCDRDDFESTEEAQGYFDERKEDELEDVLTDLTALIEDFKASRSLDDGVEYHCAESSQELAEIFKLVSRAPTIRGRNQSPHPWPLLEKVEIHQDKDILNAGVVLADCPGITDSNQGVVSSTTNYLKQAGTIIIFEKIERIKDNPALDANIRACLRLGKRANIRLMITMIDLKQRNRPEDRSELSPSDRIMLNEAESVVSELKKRKASLKEKKNHATGEEYKRIDKEYEDVPKKIAMAEAFVDQLNIEIRNRDVEEHLRGKIKHLERSPTSPDLPVFFISNTQYQQHLKGYDPEKPPCLDVQGSGIPLVRYMLYELPARGKSHTLQQMCCRHLPTHLRGIVGILTKSSLARKEEVAKLIKKTLNEHQTLLKGLEEDLEELFNRHIVAVIAANENKWSEKASKLVGSWEKIHSSTFKAFCRRAGRWRVKKGEPMISWNNKIQTIFEERLERAFNDLENDITRTATNTATNIKELFRRLERHLDECADFQGNSNEKAFFEVIRLTRNDLNNEIKKLFDIFIGKVMVIRNSTLLEDEDKRLKSYVSAAMDDTYTRCDMTEYEERKNKRQPGTGRKSSKKSGVQAQCVDALRGRLMGTDQEKSIFAAVSDSSKAAFDTTLATWTKQCQDILENACMDIIEDFDNRFVVDDIKTEEDDEGAEVLKDAAIKALGRAEGELKQYVEEFEAYEKSGRAMK